MKPFTLTSALERSQTLLRARPWLLDAMLAIAVIAISAISRPGLSVVTPQDVLYTGVVIGSACALVARRTFPRLALTVLAVLLTIHLIARIEWGIAVALICVIAAYTTQTQLTPPWRWLFLAAIYLGAATAMLTVPMSAPGLGTRERLLAAAGAFGLLTVAVLTGVVRRQRRSRYNAAIERAAMLQTQQETERRLAVVEERARIAREMHDVIGHSLNAIAVQAEGVRHVLRTDTDRADRALADIGALSRSAVDDVRDLLDVLATDDAEASTRPLPTIRDIPELVGSLQYTNAAIRLRIDGEPHPVPDHVGAAAYRIVQEGLTNSLKHAEGALVTVLVAIRDRTVGLTILNTSAPTMRPASNAGGGHGIDGMRERARAHGGDLDAGPDPTTGGWRVTASLPWGRP